MSAIKVPAIFTAIDKFSNPVKRMSRSTQTFAQKAEVSIARLDRRMRRLTPSIGAMGKQMLGFAATGAIFAGVGSAIRTIKDFEQANADLSAVLSSATAPQLEALAKDAARLGGITSKTATEVVGLQEAFGRLGFETPDILNMTEGVIAGSVAMNAELAETADLTGAVIKTFNDLESSDTTQIIDQMTLSTQKSALNFEKLQTALPIVSKAADASKISFEEMSASLGVLSDGGIDASSSASALRNIYLEAAKRQVPYKKLLDQISKSTNKLGLANEIFGKRGAVVAVTLAENIEKQEKLTKTLEKARKGGELSGAAQDAAKKRLHTLGGAITLLSSKWDSLLIASNDSTGGVGKLTDAVIWLTKHLKTIATWVLRLTGLWLGMKVALFAARNAMLAYNIILGVQTLLSGSSAMALRGNTIALSAYKSATILATFATKIWTGVQWALNVALNANPIGLVVVAILALTAAIAVIIKYYDQWGAAATMLLGPVGMLVSIVQEFRRSWDGITNAFKTGGIKAGIIEIGKVLVSALLNPIQQLFALLAKIPGLGTIAGGGVFLIDKIKDKIGIETPAINPKQTEQDALKQTIENNTNTNATLTVLAPKGTTKLEQDDNFFPSITTSLLGGFN